MRLNKFIFIAIIIATLGIGYLAGLASQNSVKASSSAKLSTQQEYSIQNCLTEFSNDKVTSTPAGFVFWYTSKELSGGLNVKLSYIEKLKANHAAHKHSGQEVYFILKGKAEMNFKDQLKIVGPNSALYCPPNVSHGIKKVGAEPLEYLVIKTE